MKFKELLSRLKVGKNLYRILIFMLVISSFIIVGSYSSSNVNKLTEAYVAANNCNVSIYDNELEEIGRVKRGTKVKLTQDKLAGKEEVIYIKVQDNKDSYYINQQNLVSNIKDIVRETNIYVRTPASIYSDIDEGVVVGVANKGQSLEVLDYDKVNSQGIVNTYQVSFNNQTGYIYGKYTVFDEATALLHYEPEKYYAVHQARGDVYAGGNAANLDYYPVEKPVFEDNIMPEKVYALYLTNGSHIISKVNEYIDYAKTTKINAFVVDIKDNQAPGYKSKVYEEQSPTNYQYASNTVESYKAAITKIKEAGFYVIGRITVFKDKYYVMDNPDISIVNSQTKEPYLHSGTFWPSPFQRKVWMFNVDLAKEAVKEMGFNEIQFDYVRFPDRTIADEKSGIMDFRNNYNEEKVQAIQRFLMYACDELHKLNVYVSADVFGESAYTYVTAYGQYWPAISNVVDVISGMPYPDHFNKYEFGFPEPVWTTPYKLLNYWASNYVVKRQTEIPTPAITRTWIQVSDVPGYKHPGGYAYGVEQIDAQIKGLFDAGLNGGYMTWLSNASLERYKSQKEIYIKEY